ncbi:MAG: T9SS C-terminal target domain-containing protein [Calditrichaeota bacterium]|nr:MAG: T9SS C-terminal target domain-containing protein [Calditrichota bacterium]
MKTFTKTLAPALALSFGIVTNCFAEYEVKLSPSDGAGNDYFGQTVDIDENYAISGAYADDDNGTSSGSAYIHKRDGTLWTQEAKLLPSTSSAGDEFGFSVSIDGDYAVVGARKDLSNGRAFVFKRNGTSWTEEAILSASDGASGDQFGYAVSIDGDYIVVGALLDNSDKGSAYIFKRDGTSWTQEAKITASDAANNDRFGRAVCISGDYVVSGAYKENSARGSAYVFKRDGTSWSEEAKITASDAANSDEFGRTVWIDGDYVISGAYQNDDNGSQSGSAYIYKRDGTSWTQEAKLTASDAATNDNFGVAVSIKDDYALVGAYDENGAAGSAYLFKRSGTSWTQESKLIADDASSNARFGIYVALDVNYAIVGAYKANSSGTSYVYSVNPFGNGDVTETVSSNTTVSFDEGSGSNTSSNEDTGMDIAFTGVTNSADIQCESFPETPTGTDGMSGTIQEVRWEITDAGLTFGNAEIRIDMTTLPVTIDFPDAAVIYHRSTPGTGSFTALATSVDGDELVANTGSFSEFAIGGGDVPLAIELDSFTARQIGNSIQLNWTTASEKDNEGFNVYRKTGNGTFVQIASYKGNSELLGALNSTTSNNYTFVDNSELRNGETYTYYISDVETNGLETKHEKSAETVRFVLNEEIAQTKLDYVLAQNFPNPFNPSTQINFQIAKTQDVRLQIFNLKGELVKELVNEKMNEGSHSAKWDGTDSFGNQVSSGTYFYKLSAGIFSKTNKMVLLK